MRIKDSFVGFVVGAIFALSLTVYAEWSKYEIINLVKETVEKCEVEGHDRIVC